MKILFLSQYFKPETGGPVKRIYGLSKELSKKGNKICVITGMPNYPSGFKPETYKRKVYVKEEIEGIKLYRYYEYASTKKSFWRRLLNYLSLTFSSMFFIFKPEKYDVIISSSPPLFLSISGYFISRVKKIPLIFDVRDIWPDIAAEMDEISSKSIYYKIMDNIANFLYRKASIVTVVTPGKKEKLIKKGIEKDKIKVISNGFDREFLDTPIKQELISEFDLRNKFSIIYTGLIGLAQDVEAIIDVAKELEDLEEIQFLIIGDGPERQKIDNLKIEKDLKNVKILGLRPPEEIFTFLTNSSASIIPLKNDKLKDSVPSKLLEAMGCGCPVILIASGEAQKIVEASGGGKVVSPYKKKELKKAIEYLYKNPENIEIMGKKGKEFILGNYNRDKIASDLLKEITIVLGGNK